METAVGHEFSRSQLRQSAAVKVKLLSKGVGAIEGCPGSLSFKEENFAYDNGNWGVVPGQAIPSEVELPGGIVAKLHVRPGSPIRLVRNGEEWLVVEHRHELTPCRLLPRPRFWGLRTSRGIPAHRLVQLYGATCLNVNIFSGCEFFNVRRACLFCSVQPTQALYRAAVVRKRPEDVREACALVVRHDRVEWYLQTGGSHVDGDREFAHHVAVLRAVRQVLPWNGRVRGNVSLMPPRDLGRIEELYELGVDHPAFNLEAWPRAAFERFCPGKAAYVGFDHIVRAMDRVVALYGPGWGWCNFVAGLVSLRDMKEGFRFVAERGIVPGANVFHPDVGAAIGTTMRSPSEEYITELYLYAAELYHRHGYRPFFDQRVLRNSLANEAYLGLLG